MGNAFYHDFDAETFPEPRRPRAGRTPFSIDRDRIIFSAAFRRLQSKTQVFHSGEYDFYRTRLTHSLEVAQIGRGICQHLRASSPRRRDDFFIDGDLVEACCLAHDIGHPPFGHAGEAALHEAMRGHGGFEGNAQTLRILTDTIFNGESGMKPTRALLEGVLKYKRVFNGAETPSQFVYAGQRAAVAWSGGENAQSVECEIMDWSDDVAYGLMDIVDGINARFITLERLERWRSGQEFGALETGLFEELKTVLLSRRLDRTFATKIGECIDATSLETRVNALSERTNRHAFTLAVQPEQRARIGFYKGLARDLIFQTPQIKQLEFKGRRILAELFATLREAYAGSAAARLLPREIEERIELGATPRERILCDYLSAMTDAEVIRTHRRLFDPQFGSIGDL